MVYLEVRTCGWSSGIDEKYNCASRFETNNMASQTALFSIISTGSLLPCNYTGAPCAMCLDKQHHIVLIQSILFSAYCYTPPAPSELWSQSCKPDIRISGTLACYYHLIMELFGFQS